MISMIVVHFYLFSPLWLIVIYFLKLNSKVVILVPSVTFFLVGLILLIGKEKIAQSLAVTNFFLLLISLLYLKINEKS